MTVIWSKVFLVMECSQQNFLSLWTVFCPFTPLTTRKIKILKNWKKPLGISSFYTSVQKIMIICYTVPWISHVTNLLFFILGYFLPLYLPNSLKNQNLVKIEKKSLEISSFYNSVPKLIIRWCMVPEIWCVMDVTIFHFGPFFALLP